MTRSKPRGLISEINVVPYVDVMLVLLVICMITAPLISQGVIIDLPDVLSDPVNAAADDPLILSVDSKGSFYLNFGGSAEEPLNDRAVLERAKIVVRRGADTPIFVRADEAAVHGRVMRGFGLLREAGAKQVVMLFDSPEVEP